MANRLMLIDGNSLTYRAFHALPPDLATSTGQITNAVLGFTNMLIYLVNDHQPDGIVVAWDRKEPTFRHKKVDTYKANRDATPDALLSQFGLVKEILTALKIPQVDKAGIEADDIIATLATKAEAAGHEVLIVTGDRDSYQLVKDPNIKVVYNKRGVSDYALYDEAGILERTGVTPQMYVQYAALRGDPSDNLPGVPGVGEKTAAKLINKYGGIDGIYEAVEEQTPKLKENLIENEQNVRMNVILMDLLRDEDLDVDIDSIQSLEEYDTEEVKKIFDLLEFKNVYKRMAEAFNAEVIEDGPKQGFEISITNIENVKECEKIIENLSDGLPFSIAPTGPAAIDSAQAHLESIAICIQGSDAVSWIPFEIISELSSDTLESAFGKSGPGLVVHRSKPLVRAFDSLSIDLNIIVDTSLACYLLDPAGNSDYDIPEILDKYTNYQISVSGETQEGQLQFEETQDDIIQDLGYSVRALSELGPVITKAIEEQSLETLLVDMEIPLAKALARMEYVGVSIDTEALSKLSEDIAAEAESLANKIQAEAGEEFNVNSTKVLQTILFDKLGLKPQKKTKTGYSTNQASLEKLVGEHPIIQSLLSYREVEKLRSTYGKPLLDTVQSDGRIHATFRQTVARTGRLSSENPNLHNIPIRSELGKNFRKVFVAPEQHQLLVADYNQIELRCIAHLAEDPGLIQAFNNNSDIHTETAAKIFDIKAEDVTSEQRNRAKMVSYGLAYGMEAYGLSQRLKISTSEAKVFLDSFFDNFPAVKNYMDSTITEARNKGYTETLFGRRRVIPELMSSNWNVRQAAERQAMNSGIQGLAADIFKMAIVNIDAALLNQKMKSRLVLQVHDEVILETPDKEIQSVKQLVMDSMMGVFDLAVPLEVNMSTAQSWAGAKS